MKNKHPKIELNPHLDPDQGEFLSFQLQYLSNFKGEVLMTNHRNITPEMTVFAILDQVPGAIDLFREQLTCSGSN